MDDRAVIVHRNFGEDLEWSNALSDEPVWAEFYFRLFPEGSGLSTTVKLPKDGPYQRHGVDRLLIFTSGMELTVDEKKRRTAYDDILLELYNDLARETPGWTIDPEKLCDYIAYAIPRLSKCYFLPYPLLREAFRVHWEEWSAAYCRKTNGQKHFEDAHNKNNGRKWITRNVPVEWSVLKPALTEQMHRAYSGNLVLPVLKKIIVEMSERQMVFTFTQNETC